MGSEQTFIRFEITNEDGKIMHVSAPDEKAALNLLNLRRENDNNKYIPPRKVVKDISIQQE